MIPLAIVLAVLGATLSAVGVQLQAAGVRAESRDTGLHLSGLPRLARNRRWLLGLAVLFVCAVLQILALAMAPVTVVAPIVVLALPMSAVLNARSTGGRLDAAASVAVLASAGGVGLFVALAAGAANSVAYSETDVLRAGELVAGVVALLGMIGAVQRGIPRCVALAAGTGAAYGLVSVLIRDVTYTFEHSGIAAVSPLSVAGLVLAFAAGSWLLQLAYASGPPDIVVGCQTVLNPLVATGLGIGMFDETVDAGGWRGIGLMAGAAVAILGVTVLARHRPDGAVRERGRGVGLLAGREPGGESGTTSSIR
ncbi:MAG TPA: DMT family transporter [Actinophytocola sp.]|uniref:DMT family transporter n=1 Tax=Actinophytocola sp. TaxID=1872138 RepID=UPI002DDCF4FC|nr:DMT family transporter [Actinophytocola sp.]HEV2781887.1 DMT family transporter [Actinophytocola sp.]